MGVTILFRGSLFSLGMSYMKMFLYQVHSDFYQYLTILITLVILSFSKIRIFLKVPVSRLVGVNDICLRMLTIGSQRFFIVYFSYADKLRNLPETRFKSKKIFQGFFVTLHRLTVKVENTNHMVCQDIRLKYNISKFFFKIISGFSRISHTI